MVIILEMIRSRKEYAQKSVWNYWLPIQWVFLYTQVYDDILFYAYSGFSHQRNSVVSWFCIVSAIHFRILVIWMNWTRVWIEGNHFHIWSICWHPLYSSKRHIMEGWLLLWLFFVGWRQIKIGEFDLHQVSCRLEVLEDKLKLKFNSSKCFL